VAQGELIAQVLPAGAPLVRAVVRNEDIALVRERPGGVSVQLAQSAVGPLAATLEHAVPRASVRLPTPALGEPAGGSIAVDPSDASGKTAREPHFQFDLRLESGALAPIGARALVTFAHGQASASELIGRFVRRSFLRHFER
jgi:putative peptide zinc metalloprotease protein